MSGTSRFVAGLVQSDCSYGVEGHRIESGSCQQLSAPLRSIRVQVVAAVPDDELPLVSINPKVNAEALRRFVASF